MKVIGITGAFLNIRSDRPPECYLRPLSDFIERIDTTDSPLHVLVFSEHHNIQRLPSHPLLKGIGCKPENLILEFWDAPNWRYIYGNLKRLPSLEVILQTNGLLPLTVWLGKFAMIKRAFEMGAEVAFWFDAGHWTSPQHFSAFHKYSPKMLGAVTGVDLVSRLYEPAYQYGILGMEAQPSLEDLHIPLDVYYKFGYSMGYANPQALPLYQGVFLLIHKDSFADFYRGCQKWWLCLVNDGYGGTEESLLTLYGWENRIARLSYLNWLSVLQGKTIENTMLQPDNWDEITVR